MGESLKRLFSPLIQLRLNLPTAASTLPLLTAPFGQFISLRQLLVKFFKNSALRFILPPPKTSQDYMLMHNLPLARVKNIEPRKARNQTLIPLVPFRRLPGLQATCCGQALTFLMDSGSLYNLINGALLDVISDQTQINFPTFSHSVRLSSHNYTAINLRERGVILPLTLDSSKGPIRLSVPFLIEDQPENDTISIIGTQFMILKKMVLDLEKYAVYISLPQSPPSVTGLDGLDIDTNFNFTVLPHSHQMHHVSPGLTKFKYTCRIPLLPNFNGTIKLSTWNCPLCFKAHASEASCESPPVNLPWVSRPDLPTPEIIFNDLPDILRCSNGLLQFDSFMQLPFHIPLLKGRIVRRNPTRPVGPPNHLSTTEHSRGHNEPYFRFHSRTFKLHGPTADLFELDWPVLEDNFQVDVPWPPNPSRAPKPPLIGPFLADIHHLQPETATASDGTLFRQHMEDPGQPPSNPLGDTIRGIPTDALACTPPIPPPSAMNLDEQEKPPLTTYKAKIYYIIGEFCALGSKPSCACKHEINP